MYPAPPGEGPNGKESESIVRLGTAVRQKTRQQLELVLEERGEAPKGQHSGEAGPAVQEDERSGSDCLMERVVEHANAVAAFKRVRKNRGSPGVDAMTVEELPEYLRQNWERIRAELLEESYRPAAVRRHEIPKSGGGVRQLGIPTVLDRFIQQSILQVLQPIFDPTFSQYSYGFRPGRSAHDAVRQAQQYVQEGRTWVVNVDLEKFFDRVNHDVLMSRLAKRIEDKRLLRVIRRYLEAGIMAEGVVVKRDEGTPQGGPLSPTPGIFRDLDQWIARRLRMLALKQWKRGTTVYRELRRRGVADRLARAAAAHTRSWWKTSRHGALNTALPGSYFDGLGIPRLVPH